MANLKSIKNRITGVKNTQKITKAMQMVATAKVKKTENATKMSRPFTWELYEMFEEVYKKLGDKKLKPVDVQNPLDNYVEILKTREVKNSAYLVINSNKGLAGAYNSNIVRFTLNKIKEENKCKNIKLYLIGNKAYTPLKNAQKTLDFEICDTYTDVLDNLNPMSVRVISEDLASAYVNREIDEIIIITTRYQNMVSYHIEDWTLLPAGTGDKELVSQMRKFHTEESKEKKKLEADTIFEPGVEEILGKLTPMYITNIIYQAILEATASELASRMTAMSAATKNADEMIRTLTIDYNKARQEKITQELTEIVSGANAIK